MGAITNFSGYAVFGTPEGFESIGNGLFERYPTLDSELYADARDFSFVGGEVWHGVMSLDLTGYGSTIIIAKWIRAKSIRSERGGGLRGAAIAFGGLQPNWGLAMRNLESLFAQTSAFCDADGRFRMGREDWQVRLPEVLPTDLSNLDLPDFENNGDRVAVFLNSEQLLAHAFEVTAGSLGLGVPRKWFFTTSQASLQKSKDEGAVYTAVFSMPLLMEHFINRLRENEADSEALIEASRMELGQKEYQYSETVRLRESEFNESERRMKEAHGKLQSDRESLLYNQQKLKDESSSLDLEKKAWKQKESDRVVLEENISQLKGQLANLKGEKPLSREQLNDRYYEGVKEGEKKERQRQKRLRRRNFKLTGASLFLTLLVFVVFKVVVSLYPGLDGGEEGNGLSPEPGDPVGTIDVGSVIERLARCEWDPNEPKTSLKARKDIVATLTQLRGLESSLCVECFWYSIRKITHPDGVALERSSRNSLDSTSAMLLRRADVQEVKQEWLDLKRSIDSAPFYLDGFLLRNQDLQLTRPDSVNDYSAFREWLTNEARKQPFWETLGWDSDEVLWEILEIYNPNDCKEDNNWELKSEYLIAIPALEEKKATNTPAE